MQAKTQKVEMAAPASIKFSKCIQYIMESMM